MFELQPNVQSLTQYLPFDTMFIPCPNVCPLTQYWPDLRRLVETVLENGPPIGQHTFSSDLICQRINISPHVLTRYLPLEFAPKPNV